MARTAGIVLLLPLAIFAPLFSAVGETRPPARGLPANGDAACQGWALEVFSAAPAAFIENAGQIGDSSVRYALHGDGVTVFHTTGGPVFHVFRRMPSAACPGRSTLDRHQPAFSSHRFSAGFPGARQIRPAGRDPLKAKANYYIGRNPRHWCLNVATYATVVYPDLYEGIDLRTWGRRSHLKYEFRVAPGADHSRIVIRYEGINGLSIDESGALHISTPLGEIVDDPPRSYQVINGRKVAVACRYRLIDATSYAFQITGPTEGTAELVIDPLLAWSSFLGGTGNDRACDIAADPDDNALITGYTYSSDFPTPGGFDTSHNIIEAFVAKISASGQLLWASFLGGSSADFGGAVAVDATGNILLTGRTQSTDFPALGAFNTEHKGGEDCFVAKVSAGGQLLWSGLLGGSGNEEGSGVATDADGNAFVAGYTGSADFPAGEGFDSALDGELDAFVARITSSGELDWAAFLGGGGYDKASDIAADADGNCLVTGYTDSSDFPTPGGFDTSHSGDWDAFVAKMAASGQLVWARFLGGSAADMGRAIAVDADGNAFVTGQTESSGFPAFGGFDSEYNDNGDAFVAKLTSQGQLEWASFLGAGGSDQGWAIATDASGSAQVAGATESPDFPTPGARNTSHGGSFDAFLAKVTSLGQLAQARFLGGADLDYAYGIAVDSDGNSLLTGRTRSADFPVGDGFDTDINGDWDAFVTKVPATFVLMVSSAPLTGVAVAGTPGGITNYAAELPKHSAASLTAPARATASGAEYVFVRWLMDGVGRPEGVVDVQATMQEDHAAEAVYYRIWYVDAAAGPGGQGTEADPFGVIQQAIDMASDGDVVIVRDGTYTGEGNRDIDFNGKAITVCSQNGPTACIIDCKGSADGPHGGFVFHNGEGACSLLKGFSITGGYAGDGGAIYCTGSSPAIVNCVVTGSTAWYGGGIFCNRASPALRNLTIAGNAALLDGGGIYCVGASAPAVCNCIIWNNTGGQISGLGPSVTYSTVEGGCEGEGNMSADPRFADMVRGDYHLKSKHGRWSTSDQAWLNDEVTSPCIDAGDPSSEYACEPEPNGHRVNMGAYGNTAEASKPAIHLLSVSSAPITDVSIAGTRPGATDYTALCPDEEVVSLTAPTATAREGVDFAFVRWEIDGQQKPEGAATVQIVMERSCTAEAVYRLVTHTLRVESDLPEGVPIGGAYPGTTPYAAEVEDEAEVSLTAPWQASGWVFIRWKSPDGVTLSFDVTCTLVMSADFTAIAEYAVVTEFYVNDGAAENGFAAGNDANPGRSPEAPMASIQALLDRYPGIAAGCTVHVSNGTYPENISIGAGHSGLALLASAPAQAVIDGGQTGSCLRFDGFTSGIVCGFTLTNGNAGEGGGVHCCNSSPTLTNCIIARNTADLGGGLYCYGSSPLIVNTTIAHNSANQGAGVYCAGESSPTATSCIIWGNSVDQIAGQGPLVAYSDVEGGCEGEGNLSADPLFADPAGDYHLRSQHGRWDPAAKAWLTDEVTSPCIDAGDPDSDFSNEPLPNLSRVNIGAYGNTAQASKSEWSLRCDVNLDCVVNILDIIGVRNHLRHDTATDENWRYDVNGDKKIDILDLIAVRNALNARCGE